MPGFQIVRSGVGWFRIATVPPLTLKIWPFTFQAASVASQTVIGATYSGSRICIAGFGGAGIAVPPLWMPEAARRSRAVSGTVAVMRVEAPGEIALQVTP